MGKRRPGVRETAVRRRALPVRTQPPSQTRASHSIAASRKRSGRALGRPMLSRLLYWTMVLGLWASMAAIGALVVAAATLPPIQSLAVPKRPPTIEILGTDGHSLASRGEMSGTDVPIRDLPPYLPKAFIAIEDRRFYSHFGVDPVGLVARRRCQCAATPRFAGRLDHHPAARQEFVSHPGAHGLAQAAGGRPGALARAQIQQAGDSRALSQPRLFRFGRLRRGSGGPALFRQVGPAGEDRGSCDARRPRAIPVATCTEPQPERRRAPRPGRADGHERGRLHQRERGE